MTGTVLVVEDDREIRELLRRYLERDGYIVRTTSSGAQALRLLGDGGVDLVVLDLGLPDVGGFEVLAAARRDDPAGRHSGVPVVVLTARAGVEDRIRGLQRGADDYVTKPFSPTELVLRVRAVLDRVSGGAGESGARCYGGGRLCIDEARHEARVGGRVVDLTPTEWGLLIAMSTTAGRVFSRYELVNRVRGYEFAGYERTIDSHVKNLRRKLSDSSGEMIQTVLGVGYRMALRPDQDSGRRTVR
ncbi:response regulator transcription factor [Phytohabitans houttuyneae]|uniref:DNA-binding response regulator n=1 Tax=Phytohabitans houttuyneae TaxID=1076126 RepID=A0A6V8KB46_9ACTN|nr:response regulator transcription factor [Phytohabitans houttuyneae]GFJ80964.1 DNA-binding response regulator [Phytohabitans houttuyneae]